jgi:hypothetical protein
MAIVARGAGSWDYTWIRNNPVTEPVFYAEAARRDPIQVRLQALLALIHELKTYQSLRVDWDGYGGHAAHPKAVTDALTFLAKLPPDLLLPKPMVAGSGLVGLYWHHGQLYTSIDFDGSGSYCFVIDRNGSASGDEHIDVSSPIPEGLVSALREIADAGA